VVAVGLVGLEIPRELYYKKELDLRLSMSYGPGRYDAEYEERGHDYPLPYVRWTEQRNMLAFLELVAAGRIDVKSLISHRYSFEKAISAYELITTNREPSLGVVLQYDQDPVSPPPRLIAAFSPSPTGRIGLGVAGAGNFAKSILLPKFKASENVTLRAVTTAKGVTASSVCRRFGFDRCAETVDDLIADETVNAVLIATRHNLHGSIVNSAIETGKHVFVEKPLCLNREELDRICQTVETLNGKRPLLMVGFNRRFSPFVQRMRAALSGRSTPLIASYRINAGFIPKESWVQDPVEGGGRIIGEVCHFVDTLRFLTGSGVRSVHAACIRTGNSRHTDRDSLAVTLTYQDGSVASIIYHALGNPEFPKERIEIAADGKIMTLDDFCRLEIFGRRKETFKGRQDKGFDAEIHAFVQAVANGGKAPIPFWEIRETTLVTFAIHQAMNTGQTVHLE
jgi:predicted dehydrogenase